MDFHFGPIYWRSQAGPTNPRCLVTQATVVCTLAPNSLIVSIAEFFIHTNSLKLTMYFITGSCPLHTTWYRALFLLHAYEGGWGNKLCHPSMKQLGNVKSGSVTNSSATSRIMVCTEIQTDQNLKWW